jgi:hypothetical protein
VGARLLPHSGPLGPMDAQLGRWGSKGVGGPARGVAITPGSPYLVAITGNDLRASVAERPVAAWTQERERHMPWCQADILSEASAAVTNDTAQVFSSLKEDVRHLA